MTMHFPLLGKVEKPLPWVIGLAAGGVVLVSTGAFVLVNSQSRSLDLDKYTVPVVTAKDLTVRISASGTVQPIQTVNLSPKTAGRLVELRVEQGDRVQQGQIIARMDDTDIQAQVMQAQASLAQAQAKYAEVLAGNRSEEIAQARERLMQATAQLRQGQTGNRSQEIAQAQAQVDAAQSQVNLTKTRVERNRALAAEGAISRDSLDEVTANDLNAQANLREAQRRLELQKQGTRSEELLRLEAQVAEARQAYEMMLRGNRPEAIAQAAAEVELQKGRLQAAQVQLEDTIIRAPFSGIVTQRYATIGAFVTPTTSASTSTSATSTSVVALARGLEVLAKVPEIDIAQIRKGQEVEVFAEAYPQEAFKGRVRLVSPEAVEEKEVTLFQVRVTLESGLDKLRSGMNIKKLNFLGTKLSDAVVVPTVAIARENGQDGVYVVGEGNKPVFRPITTGSFLQDKTQVLSGVKPGDRVFTDFPENLRPKLETNQ
jgi:HlyD family secretion protein